MSIFAPHATEHVPGADSELVMERPVTPIDVSCSHRLNNTKYILGLWL